MQIRNIRRLHVFISCPSDVEVEKKLVEEVCDQLTEILEPLQGVELKPIRWPDDIIPMVTGEDAQASINEQIGRYNYDIHIGIMWKRFGDEKANRMAPTREEFEVAFNSYKQNKKPIILFYFKCDKVFPRNVHEASQLLDVLRFKEELRSRGAITMDFEGEEWFRKKIRHDLFETIQTFYLSTAGETEVSKIRYCAPEFYLPRRVCPRKDFASGRLLYCMDKYAKDTLDIISDCKRVTLVGDAGTGKTTELKRIAAYFSKVESPFYPFLVSLNKYVDQSLSELLPAGWQDIIESKIAVILDCGYT